MNRLTGGLADARCCDRISGMNGDEAVALENASHLPVRAAFLFSCLSLAIAIAVLVSVPTLHTTASTLLYGALAAIACAIGAIIVSALARGPLTIRIASLMAGVLSLAVWGMVAWGMAILSAGQFVR